MDIADGVEQTNLNPIFFLECHLLNANLHYHGDAHFSPIDKWREFSKTIFLYTCDAAVESKSLHLMLDCDLPTQNE